MRNTYRHLFFDLDHTLWDFETNSNQTLTDLYTIYDFNRFDFDLSRFLNTYQIENKALWAEYNHGRIDQQELRKTRFRRVLTALGMNPKDIPEGIDEQYLEICPQKSNVIPHTFMILDYLKEKYDLHIITNGFDDVQDTKLTASGLKGYFDGVITSELAGHLKPHRGIFEFALEYTGAEPALSLVIGDNLETDIAGARNAKLDHVFFNPGRLDHRTKPTYEIHSLEELMNIL